MAKKIKIAVIGYGDRGSIYANYAYTNKEEAQIVAVVDLLEYRLKEASEKFNVPQQNLFTSIEDFINAKIECDLVVNATMDQQHYQTAVTLIENGYNVLLEKPVTAKKEELLDIERRVKEKGTLLFVCHVMRYSPYFVKVKELINNGAIGEIVALEMNEHVSKHHYLTSYVRGRWHSEEECGSGLLLAKSCHDLDLMCWLNNITEPDKVSSFGTRAHFVREKAPDGSAERCFDCKYLNTCEYSAKTAHLDLNEAATVTWSGIAKPISEITEQDKIDFLKTSIFGQCAYKIESTLVDRQVVSVMFKNGSIGTLNMLGGTTKGGRTVHITGTKGEIQGYWESSKFVLRVYDGVKQCFSEQEFDVAEQVKSGHMGGDASIMRDMVKFLNGDFSSFSITKIEDSINGHLCVYGAEDSRKTNRIISIDELRS